MINRLRKRILFAALLIFILFLFYNQPNEKKANIQYIPLGDSYKIGFGVDEKDRWPNLLVRHLKVKGVNIVLLANPAVSGYTVRDAIEIELPLIAKIKPNLVTVLIGANDNFGQKSAQDYQIDLGELLDKLQALMKDSKKIILITIPDHSKSPAFREYEKADVQKLIEEYNNVIKIEAKKRGLMVADIYAISQKFTDNEYFIYDGLHPSSLGYAEWEEVIFPVVFETLKEKE